MVVPVWFDGTGMVWLYRYGMVIQGTTGGHMIVNGTTMDIW